MFDGLETQHLSETMVSTYQTTRTEDHNLSVKNHQVPYTRHVIEPAIKRCILFHNHIKRHVKFELTCECLHSNSS